jgi:outer membrane protein, heavy metal efflux system
MKTIASILFLVLSIQTISAQTDTVRMSLKEMDKRFLDKNLSLLVSKANIDIAKAQTQQARLWDNPTVSTDNNIFHPANDAIGQSVGFFDPAQISIQIQQLFKLGKKRQKQVDVNLETEKLNEFQFFDLTRNLKHQLHADYSAIVGDYKAIQVYQTQQKTISSLLEVMQGQVDKGYIARKEVIRIKAELVGVQHNITDAINRINDAQADLRVLLQALPNQFILPIDATLPAVRLNTDNLNPTDLVATALQSRGDISAANSQLEITRKNLILQRSLAVPDLTVGTYFQKNGNAFVNDVGLTLSIPIPVLNKNEGNIKAADVAIKQQQSQYELSVSQVTMDIYAKYIKLKQLEAAHIASKEEQFNKEFDDFYQNLVKTFQNRQITLLEFIDFFESYKDLKLQQIQYQQQIRQAADDLNFVVGKTVIE